jgi:hypothetical protein
MNIIQYKIYFSNKHVVVFFLFKSDSVIFANFLFAFSTVSYVIVCIKNICNYVLNLRHLKYCVEVLYHMIEWGKGVQY